MMHSVYCYGPSETFNDVYHKDGILLLVVINYGSYRPKITIGGFKLSV